LELRSIRRTKWTFRTRTTPTSAC